MNQVYMDRFVALFFTLTGLKIEEAIVGHNGWLFIPLQVDFERLSEKELVAFGILGWQANSDRDGAGWWVKPWPIVKEETFVVVTLNEIGAKSFIHLKNGEPGQRHVYYVEQVSTSGLNGCLMLFGQFIFDWESFPVDSLNMDSTGMNSIYYPYDEKIATYGTLTPEEELDTVIRLRKVVAKSNLELHS